MPAGGIPGTHDIPLGSHPCLFYRAPEEFLHVTMCVFWNNFPPTSRAHPLALLRTHTGWTSI